VVWENEAKFWKIGFPIYDPLHVFRLHALPKKLPLGILLLSIPLRNPRRFSLQSFRRTPFEAQGKQVESHLRWEPKGSKLPKP
jgi:hypothetical protein